ncbi:MAG: response regulator transcription factor [Bacteroidales bacterium]|nr:response regulator transcription factor [Bacteroidales bacterium]SKC40061.1 DNA-binding response regulator, OmpR family, contains REC and winged-helix (wHTH) domain [Bacteroidales bacterium WCE2008]MBQ1856605.1 response regulator transcription factor [Bacteroidales bacterium]MBQ2109799.1 response regulator transcription factor [Bacteroidales bacterium]MBQ3916517.1 response regulator transcription factor [Bacteroidales bacterium]
MNPKKSILVVDDEQDLCDIISFNLEKEGYAVDSAFSAEEALKKDLGGYDLLLLDVMMGGMSGFKLAARLKADPKTTGIPIIFLTARDSEDDTVKGLELGADDYVSKPFSIRELLARIGAVLRRSSGSEEDKLVYEGLVLDKERKIVTVDGEEVFLTRTEFDLLQLLLSDQGRVFSRSELIGKVWPDDVLVLDRTVDVNITRLRKKIGQYSTRIHTRSGFGYYFGK